MCPLLTHYEVAISAQKTQPTKVKVVDTFHVPFTQNAGQPLDVRGTWERGSDFCRLRPRRMPRG
jgi:hypothetical protein